MVLFDIRLYYCASYGFSTDTMILVISNNNANHTQLEDWESLLETHIVYF